MEVLNKSIILSMTGNASHFFRVACVSQLQLPTLALPCSSQRFCHLQATKGEPVEQKFPYWVKTDTDKSIYEASSASELLHFSSKPLTIQQVGSVISLLSKRVQMKEVDAKEVTFSVEFDRLCKTVANKVSSLPHGMAVASLRNLLILGLDETSHTIQTLETEMLWRLRKMPVSKIINLVTFMCNYQHTDLGKQLYNEALNLIQLRWVEINSAKELLKILYKTSEISSEFFAKLENKALELLDKMTIHELHKLLCILTEKQHRSMPLLRAISYHVTRKQDSMNIDYMMNFMYACNVLRFFDQQLLQCISTNLCPEIINVKQPFIISSLLTSFGHLKWRHTVLLDLFTDFMEKNFSRCREQEFTSYVMALARLNYKPTGNQAQVLFCSIVFLFCLDQIK